MSWRIGLLIPSSNSVMEVDLYRGLPHDATVHTGRMYMVETTRAGEDRMLKEFAIPAAETLGTALPHVVVFGCTSAGALHGKAYDQELCARIGEVTGAIPISVIGAVNQALGETHAKSVAVITPYVDELNKEIKASIEAEGIEVTAMHGMGITNNFDIATVTPDEIVDFTRERLGAQVPADALFLSCTNFNAMSALSALKISYDLPIVTSNWAALKAVRQQLDTLRQAALPDAATSPAAR